MQLLKGAFIACLVVCLLLGSVSGRQQSHARDLLQFGNGWSRNRADRTSQQQTQQEDNSLNTLLRRQAGNKGRGQAQQQQQKKQQQEQLPMQLRTVGNNRRSRQQVPTLTNPVTNPVTAPDTGLVDGILQGRRRNSNTNTNNLQLRRQQQQQQQQQQQPAWAGNLFGQSTRTTRPAATLPNLGLTDSVPTQPTTTQMPTRVNGLRSGTTGLPTTNRRNQRNNLNGLLGAGGNTKGRSQGRTTSSPADVAVYRQRLNGLVQPAIQNAGRYSRSAIQPSSTLAQGLAGHINAGDATAAASSVATAAAQSPDAAAQGWVSAAAAASSTSSVRLRNSRSAAAAESFAQAATLRPGAAPRFYARSAAVAVTSGQSKAFGASVAQAFAVSRRRGHLPQFTRAVADAISQSGSQGSYAYGQAIATAIASGGDGRAAVAEATATAFCTGGSTAQAWASAYAVALAQNDQGCLVLNEARAIAVARCSGGRSFAQSSSSTTSTVLGFCWPYLVGPNPWDSYEAVPYDDNTYQLNSVDDSNLGNDDNSNVGDDEEEFNGYNANRVMDLGNGK